MRQIRKLDEDVEGIRLESNPYLAKVGDDEYTINDDNGHPIWTGNGTQLTEAIAALSELAATLAVKDGITVEEALSRIGEQYGGSS